jgi:hypothetical protein
LQIGIPLFYLLKLWETARKHHIRHVVSFQRTKRINRVVGRQKLAEVSQPLATDTQVLQQTDPPSFRLSMGLTNSYGSSQASK